MKSFPITLNQKTLFPARLVKITRLDGVVLRIAEADESLVVDGNTFAPLPGAEISAVKHILNGDMPSMEIKFAHSVGGTLDTTELNDGFWDGAAVLVYLVDRASLSILGDPLFKGVIDTVTVDAIEGSCSFDIRGLAAQAEAFIQTYQPMCRTDLFSSLCQINKTLWAQTGTIDTIVDRFNFTVAGLSSPPADGWFNQGTFETASGFKELIANWDLGTLTITTYQPRCLARLTAGQGLTLYPGCDKTGTTCRVKFNNKGNFQGEDHFLGINSIVGV
jgi:uncharacterized phage protein (TIGR02218 family)